MRPAAPAGLGQVFPERPLPPALTARSGAAQVQPISPAPPMAPLLGA